jgi:hypothetical protein
MQSNMQLGLPRPWGGARLWRAVPGGTSSPRPLFSGCAATSHGLPLNGGLPARQFFPLGAGVSSGGPKGGGDQSWATKPPGAGGSLRRPPLARAARLDLTNGHITTSGVASSGCLLCQETFLGKKRGHEVFRLHGLYTL